jgi:DNA invertase Pin-like site-specific DNA recombinase
MRLLSDIEDGLVDVIIRYKIDRLSRSLMDFSKLVEVFDRNEVTFVSVTQSFNTTTSMGRLTLNILLSFAQFEREVTCERIRDKIAASRRKGMWMGGCPPFGYDVRDRKLVIDPKEAEHVRWIFDRFVEIGSGTRLVRDITARGITTKKHQLITKGLPVSPAQQPRLHRRGRAQGHELSRRTSGHHQPKDLGQGSCHPDREPTEACRPHPAKNPCPVERSAVRPGRSSILAHPHPQVWQPAFPHLGLGR